MSQEEIESIKVTLLGNSGVGKTCIIKRYLDDEFSSEEQVTPSANFSQKEVTIGDKTVILDIWDTAGQEQYRSMSRNFYKDSYIVCLVYDITNKDSFEDLKNIWYNELITYGEKYTVTAVVGNKSDCFEKEEVKEEEASNYAKSIKANYFMVSAKEGINIDSMFKTLAASYLGPEFSAKIKEIINDKGSSQKIRKTKSKKKGKKCC